MNDNEGEILYLYKVFDPVKALQSFCKDPVGTIQRNIDDFVGEKLTHYLDPPQRATVYDEKNPKGRSIEIEYVYYQDGVKPLFFSYDDDEGEISLDNSDIVFEDADYQAQFIED